MRILLVSDTHGRLGQMDALALKLDCDAVIHAGDFGFYDGESVERLSEREINLHIAHADLGQAEKATALGLTLGERRDLVRERLPLSDLPLYLAGERRFSRPLYAVWGNHEDVDVVRKFHRGEYAVPNLHVLHEESSFPVGECMVVGLGGNLLTGRKLFQGAIAGGGGKVWSTLQQYLRLIDRSESAGAEAPIRVMVSHVSPGKEPLVTIAAAAMGASLVVSGHMGAPYPMGWNEFAIREPDESVMRLRKYIALLASHAETIGGAAQEAVGALANHLERSIGRTVAMGRGAVAPRWYRDLHFLNLPDCDVGHAVLVVENGSFRIESLTAGGRGIKRGNGTANG
jgi:predicted phosphodiesterase